MDVNELTTLDSACDEFVRQNPHGKLEYTQAWSHMVERIFGHKAFYIVVHKKGSICGVLPLMHIRSRLFGNRIISQAFSTYGGALVNDRDALASLYDKAIQISDKHGCEFIEFRNIEPLPYKLQTSVNKVCMYFPLSNNPENIWADFKKKIRKLVRKSEKSGISVENGGIELLDDFYKIWTLRMHQLGIPCYSKKLFSGILETFPDNCQIFVARLGKKAIAAKYTYSFRDFVQSRWAAGLLEYRDLCPNYLLSWKVIRYYCLARASLLDFGTSTVGSSQHEFKKRWGAVEIPLHYQYWTRPGHRLSLIKPDNPKYKKKVEIWKKLPLWVTRLAGPSISRNLA